MALNIDGGLHEKVHTSSCVRSLMSNHDVCAFADTGPCGVGEISGYTIFCLPRPDKANHGGVAISIKGWLTRHTRVVRQHPTLGILWICISLPNRRPLYVAACYLPPGGSTYYKDTPYTIDTHFDALRADISEFSHLGRVLLCGDLNARVGTRSDVLGMEWGALQKSGLPTPPVDGTVHILQALPTRRTCDPTCVGPMGAAVLDMCKSCQVVILNGRLPGDSDLIKGGACTFHATGRQAHSLVDYFIASPDLAFEASGRPKKGSRLCVAYPRSLGNTIPRTTDHSYVSLTVPLSKEQQVEHEQGGTRYRFDREAVDPFNEALEEHLDRLDEVGAESLSSTQSLHLLQSILNDALQHTHRLGHNILSRGGGQCVHRPQNTWYNAECAQHKRAWNAAVEASGPASAPAKMARNAYRRFTKCTRKAYEDKQATLLATQWKHDPKSFWKSYHSGAGDCMLANVNTWAEYFSALFGTVTTPDPLTNPPSHPRLYQSPTESMLNNAAVLSEPFSESEVEMQLAQLKRHKAPGVDGVPAEYLLCAGPSLVPAITRLFNSFMRDSYPSELSVSVIVPVPKPKGDPMSHDSYRGIAVGSSLAKLFSMVMNARADDWAEDHGLRAEGQFGFRRDRGTVHAAFALRHLVEQYGSCRRPLYCAFIDFKKAYDSVDRSKLWECLVSLGMHGDFMKALQDMYADVRMRVRLGGRLSSFFSAFAGVKQGDPLSPLLFGLFVDRIEQFFAAKFGATTGAKVADSIVRVLLYADDLVLCGETQEELQALLDCLHEFCHECGMTVNSAKSEVVCFNPEHMPRMQQKWMYDGVALPVSEAFRYLGIVFCGRGQDGGVRNAWKQQMKGAQAAMYAMWKRCHALHIRNVRTLCYLFDALVRPIASYGCEVWGPEVILKCHGRGAAVSEAIQNTFMRMALGVRSSTAIPIMLTELGRKPMWMFWLRQCTKFWNRVAQLPDEDLVKRCMVESVTRAMMVPPSKGWASSFLQCLCSTNVLQHRSEAVELGDRGWRMKTVDMEVFATVMQQSMEGVWEGLSGDPRQIPDSRHNGTKLSTFAAWVRPEGGFNKWRAFSASLDTVVDITNVARFRMGSHSLNVEALRWCRPSIPRSARVCQCCGMGVVEDECHFLLECPRYARLRGEYKAARGFQGVVEVNAMTMRRWMNCESRGQWQALANFLRCGYQCRALSLSGPPP